MSVYEIEKTIERIGAALTDPKTKIESKDPNGPDPRDDLVKQIENWRTVLANYRAATVRDQAKSIAEQLSNELNGIHANFESFLEDATTGGPGSDQFTAFLTHGLNEIQRNDWWKRDTTQENLLPNEVANAQETAENEKERVDPDNREKLKAYDNNVLDRVNDAFHDCVEKVELAEPGGPARLCDVYRNISASLELKQSLFGICNFKDELASVEAFCTVLISIIIFDRPCVSAAFT